MRKLLALTGLAAVVVLVLMAANSGAASPSTNVVAHSRFIVLMVRPGQSPSRPGNHRTGQSRAR